MPRIRCPNCGVSINLETRRELDYKMILSGMQKSSKTFTDLLKITGLPRKTLSMRLTALCDSGVIVKDGGYRLNGASHVENCGGKMDLPESQALAKPSFFTRRNVLVTLMLLVIAVPIAANVSAMLFTLPASPPSPAPPLYIGTFQMDINVEKTTDLFAWQVLIRFNSSELVFLEAVEGNFLKAHAIYDTVFLFANDTYPGELLVFDTLKGMDVRGVSGTGTLATLTFGYKLETYELPQKVYDGVFETFLWNSDLKDTEGTMTLEVKEG